MLNLKKLFATHLPQNQSGFSTIIIAIIVGVVIIGVSVFLIIAKPFDKDEVTPSPTPITSPSMTATPSATIKATFKPTLKPTVAPTPTSTPTPSPTPTQTSSSNNSSCNNGSANINIQPNNGSVVGDTLVRLTVKSNDQGCNANVSKEEILRNGQSSITFNDLTPATYNIFVGYHGNQYNESFTVSSGGNTSKTINVTN